MPSGTASRARPIALFSKSQVPITMTTETTRLIAGSSHSHAVRPMISPATTTPAVTSASAAICINALLMLRSRPRPETNSRAVPPLTAIPMAATQHHDGAVDRHRLGKAQQRLPGDTAGDDQQDHGVGEGGEDRTRFQPIGEPAARAAPAQHRRAPGQARGRAHRSNCVRHPPATPANATTPRRPPRPQHRRGSARSRSQTRAHNPPGRDYARHAHALRQHRSRSDRERNDCPPYKVSW